MFSIKNKQKQQQQKHKQKAAIANQANNSKGWAPLQEVGGLLIETLR